MYLPIQELLDADLRAREETRKPRGDYWYASEIGYCPRKAFLSRLEVQGEPKDARTLRVFELGKIHEAMLLDGIANNEGKEIKGIKIIKARREVECNDDKLCVHARADLVSTLQNSNEIWDEVTECKSQSSRSFTYMVNKGEGASEHHVCQLWFYLHTLVIEKGQLIYSSKDDLRAVQFPVNLSNEKVANMVLGKINFLNQNWADKKLPEAEDSWLCKYCDYRKICPTIKNFNQITKQ